jgi:flagellar basal-body rod protein FlgG
MTSLNTLLGITASGMLSQQFNLDVISNNMANVNSAGYKRVRADFTDVVMGRASAGGESGLPVAGVQVSASQTLFAPGIIVPTGDNLNLSIQGDGYFQVRLPDGSTGYTRDGSFTLDVEGRLVNSAGLELLPGFQFNVAADDIQISPEGRITVSSPDGVTEAGRITLATFAESANLLAVGNSVFKETPASGAPVVGAPGSAGFGALATQTVERSNVDLADEMLNLITAQRAYQLSSRATQVVDEMMQAANDLRR